MPTDTDNAVMVSGPNCSNTSPIEQHWLASPHPLVCDAGVQPPRLQVMGIANVVLYESGDKSFCKVDNKGTVGDIVLEVAA